MRDSYGKVVALIDEAIFLSSTEEGAVLRYILDSAKHEAQQLGQQIVTEPKPSEEIPDRHM